MQGQRVKYYTLDGWDRVQEVADRSTGKTLGFAICPLRKLLADMASRATEELIWSGLHMEPDDYSFEIEGQVFNFLELIRWAAAKFHPEAA